MKAGGYINDNERYNVGSWGNYWSTVYNSSVYAFIIYLNSGYFALGGEAHRRTGLSIRPVANPRPW